jgi:hypothetical protein
VQTVSGLGTEAFFQEGLGVLWVRKGKTALSLQGVSVDNPIVADAAALQGSLETLAKNALKRV